MGFLNVKTLNNATTSHCLVTGDSRDLSFLRDESCHLAVTSPPYWTLKRYNEREGQLGYIEDYELFLAELEKVWREVYRILIPGGRLVCVVGDVCLARRRFGRHIVVPLHADISVMCRRIGFDNLNPIIWFKIANASFEVENGTKFLGKPYEPNAIIKNDIEFILMQRKPGGYRQPTALQRSESRLTKKEHDEWFRQTWNLTGASTKQHPAPFPVELAYRLIRMFSFVDDTVFDPFCGIATTSLGAIRAGRHSIGIELDPEYLKLAEVRLQSEKENFFDPFEIHTFKQEDLPPGALPLLQSRDEQSTPRTRRQVRPLTAPPPKAEKSLTGKSRLGTSKEILLQGRSNQQ
jgi:site-specific DNA-methyltransferase (adenine-specific)